MADAGEGAPPPRANPLLLGHEAAEAGLCRLAAAGTLPHAMLLAGPRGIGKATLAFRLARAVFAGFPGEGLAVPPEHPAFRRVAAAAHGDLRVVERAYDPKRNRTRGEIVVDDTRGIEQFLRLTSAEEGWRIVIVDSADDMNRNAANALLKILEEPPRRALLMLVAHNAASVLPTIRSRCRRMTLQALAPETVAALLRRYRPELAAADTEMLTRLAEGSIGRALGLAEGEGLKLYRDFLRLAEAAPTLDVAALHAFADRLGRAEAEEGWRVFADLSTAWVARLGCAASGAATPEALPPHLLARGPAPWVAAWERIGRIFAEADGLNLDRKQAVLSAFFAIEAAAKG